jgi:hypothetical protein
MTDHATSTGGARCHDEGAAAALGIAKGLCLAATPTFAIMALMTGVLGGGSMNILCSAGHPSPLSGMVPMYILMSAFHSAPWLKLISSRRRVPIGMLLMRALNLLRGGARAWACGAGGRQHGLYLVRGPRTSERSPRQPFV